MADPKFTPDQPFFKRHVSRGREGGGECSISTCQGIYRPQFRALTGYPDVGTHGTRVFSEP